MEVRPVRPEEAEEAGRLTVGAYDTIVGLPIDDDYRAELRDVAGRARHCDVLVAVDDADPVADAHRPAAGGARATDRAAPGVVDVVAPVTAGAEPAADSTVGARGPSPWPRLLGCVTFVPGPGSPAAEFIGERTAGIRMLAVDPAARGRGVGEALTRACLERAAAIGGELVVLHTTRWMAAAQRLYERLGFERASELDREVAPGLQLLAYRYELRRPARPAP
jgi:ribosomal protein S18 acetylase RimI-like enzyme